MRRVLLSLVLLLPVQAVHAQWRLALLAGSASAHGDSHNDTDPSHPAFHAASPATATVALGRELSRWRLSLEARHSSADLSEVSSSSIVVTTTGAFDAWGSGIEAAVRVAGNDHAAALRVGLGAGLDRWEFDLAASRWRPSGRGAIEGDFAVGHTWNVVIRGELTVGPSMFIQTELPEGFATRTMWRTGIALGVARTWRGSAIRP